MAEPPSSTARYHGGGRRLRRGHGLLESAVVVYLREALGATTGAVFPLDLSSPNATSLGWIEVGREAATLLMIGAVGWIAGRQPLERLAWAAVVFGAWDIGYYFWLWVFSGWPSSLGTWDLLFLLPLPWVGPVCAPVTVSLALVGFGLTLVGRYGAGASPGASLAQLALLLLGGGVVIVSFLLNAGLVLDGGSPSSSPGRSSGWGSRWASSRRRPSCAPRLVNCVRYLRATGASSRHAQTLGTTRCSSEGARR